jgi:hypothetical protein
MSYLLNYKKWSALYEQAKADAALFEDGGDDIIAADGKTANVDGNKIKPKEDEELPKDLDQRIKYLVDKAVDTDSAAVKAAGKTTGFFVRPWDAIMDWMFAKGDPGKETENVKKLIEYTPNYAKKIEDAKPTIKKADIARCMEQWHGIFNDEGKTAQTEKVSVSVNGNWVKGKTDGKNPQVESAIDTLTKLSDPAFVSKLIDKDWKKADGYPEGSRFNIFGKEVTFTSPDMQFDKELIVKKSKEILDKLTSTMKKTGKSPRTGLDVQYTQNDADYTTDTDKSMFLVPKIEFKKVLTQEEKNKLMYREKQEEVEKKFSKDATANFFMWYSIISNEESFKQLQGNLDDPDYVKTNYVKMTEKDKIDIINGIMEESRERWAKSSWVSPEAAIYFATSIMWWPVKAQETMPQTIVVTPAGEGTEVEYENEWDFSWPYAKDGGQELAMTYFKSDKAIIQDGKVAEIDNAVKQILAEIKSKNGTLKSLTYKVVASTSDEPSAYATLNQTTTNIGIQNNFPLVKDRAKVIEDALIAAINTNGIDKTLVIRDGESLVANNTLGGQAVFNEKKWMRTDRNYGKGPNGETPNAQTNAEYQALFSKAKHSGILFNVVYTTIEKEKGEPTPEETTVSDYKVVGEWLYQITWSGSGGYKKKKRRTRPRRPIRGINWDKVFPPLIDVLGVDDLCDAYGRSGPG